MKINQAAQEQLRIKTQYKSIQARNIKNSTRFQQSQNKKQASLSGIYNNKRKLSSQKLFETAHKPNYQETFLKTAQMQKQNLSFKISSYKSLSPTKNQAKSEQRSLKSKKTTSAQQKFNNEQKTKMQVNQTKMQYLVKDQKQKEVSHALNVKKNLNRIVYGQQNGQFQQKSFIFINQSSILGNENGFFLQMPSYV